MRPSLLHAATAVALLGSANAQLQSQLSDSIQNYTEFSLFRSLLDGAGDAFNSVVSKDSENTTVLIPTNDAIQEYLTASGFKNPSDISPDDLTVFFSYHIMAASLTGSDFEKEDKGMTVPTLLTGQRYNNRSAGAQLTDQFGERADGQVLFATKSTVGTKKGKRALEGPLITLRAGVGQDAQLTAVDGKWGPDGGNSFQAVDKVLLPPRECSFTARNLAGEGLEGLDTALNRTGLWPALDTSSNVTCLAPSTDAFDKAGNPQDSLDETTLSQALLAHTLDEVTYTNFLVDGQVLGTLNKTKVTVHIKGDDIYFNNAKIIKPNVLTNNGLIHILDSLIEPEDVTTATATTSATETATATVATSPTSTNNAVWLLPSRSLGLISALVGLLLM